MLRKRHVPLTFHEHLAVRVEIAAIRQRVADMATALADAYGAALFARVNRLDRALGTLRVHMENRMFSEHFDAAQIELVYRGAGSALYHNGRAADDVRAGLGAEGARLLDENDKRDTAALLA